VITLGCTECLLGAAWPQEVAEEWEERAAIMEFDGGLPRPEAEAAAGQRMCDKYDVCPYGYGDRPDPCETPVRHQREEMEPCCHEFREP
jgi:hypothetical protein